MTTSPDTKRNGSDAADPNGDNERAPGMAFMGHLFELRDRLVRAIFFFLLAFAPLAYFATDLYSYFIRPVVATLPAGSTLIATQVASQFLAPLSLATYGAIFISAPVLLYQLWAFVAPGLYKHEKRLAFPLLIGAIVLFYLGAAFAYFVVVPVCFKFFASIQIQGVQYLPDIAAYMDFALFMFLIFGVSFEVPIVILILVRMGVVSPAKLSEWRGYIVVGIFILAAVLTPPDAISQIMMAVPMWLLYEGGLLTARLIHKKEEAENA